jgi:hypothetical protein
LRITLKTPFFTTSHFLLVMKTKQQQQQYTSSLFFIRFAAIRVLSKCRKRNQAIEKKKRKTIPVMMSAVLRLFHMGFT